MYEFKIMSVGRGKDEVICTTGIGNDISAWKEKNDVNHIEQLSFREQNEPAVLPHRLNICFREEKRKDERNMGLVGIMKNKNGIVAFADEKSCMNVMGIPYAASPKTVKKVFRGGNFLFVTHGANQLPEPRVYDLENAIRETKPENYSDYYRYFEVLWKRIQETGSLYLTKYNFTVGYPDTYLVDGKRTGNYGISTCYFDKIRVNYTSTTYFDDIIISGEDRFLPKVIHVRQDWTLQEMEDYCRKLVETSIYFSESTLKDNSIIGGRAIVETYVDSTL